jgi:hypothetical protein
MPELGMVFKGIDPKKTLKCRSGRLFLHFFVLYQYETAPKRMTTHAANQKIMPESGMAIENMR